MSADLRLAYFNPAWVEFARDNHSSPVVWSPDYLGTPILDVVPQSLRGFYLDVYRSSMRRDPKKTRPLQLEYECSSSGTFRQFAMTLYPLPERQGLIMVNSLVFESEHDPRQRPAHCPRVHEYMNDEGMIHQCAHCRRVQNASAGGRWDWVPQWVDRIPPQASHGLCSLCLDHYYVCP